MSGKDNRGKVRPGTWRAPSSVGFRDNTMDIRSFSNEEKRLHGRSVGRRAGGKGQETTDSPFNLRETALGGEVPFEVLDAASGMEGGDDDRDEAGTNVISRDDVSGAPKPGEPLDRVQARSEPPGGSWEMGDDGSVVTNDEVDALLEGSLNDSRIELTPVDEGKEASDDDLMVGAFAESGIGMPAARFDTADGIDPSIWDADTAVRPNPLDGNMGADDTSMRENPLGINRGDRFDTETESGTETDMDKDTGTDTSMDTDTETDTGSGTDTDMEDDIGTADTAVGENPLGRDGDSGSDDVDVLADTIGSDPPGPNTDGDSEPLLGEITFDFEENIGESGGRTSTGLSDTLNLRHMQLGLEDTEAGTDEKKMETTSIAPPDKKAKAGAKVGVEPELAEKFEKYGDVYYAIERAYVSRGEGGVPREKTPLNERLDNAIETLEIAGTSGDWANIMRLKAFRKAFFGNPETGKSPQYNVEDYNKWIEAEKLGVKGAAQAFISTGINPGEYDRKGTLNALASALDKFPSGEGAMAQRRIKNKISAYGDYETVEREDTADVMRAMNEERKAETFFEMVLGVASKEIIGRVQKAEDKMRENALKADSSSRKLAAIVDKQNREREERELEDAVRTKRWERTKLGLAGTLLLAAAGFVSYAIYGMQTKAQDTDTSGNNAKNNGAEVAKDVSAPQCPGRVREQKAMKAPKEKEAPVGGKPPKPKEPTASGEEGAKVAVAPAPEAESAEAAGGEPEMSPRERLVAEIEQRCFKRQEGDKLSVSPEMLRAAYGSILGRLDGSVLPSDFEAWGTLMINTKFPNKMFELAVMVDILSEWQYEDMRAPWVVYAAGMKAASTIGFGAGRPGFWGNIRDWIKGKIIPDPTKGKDLSQWGDIVNLGDVDAKRCAAAVMAVKVEQIFRSIKKRAHEQMSATDFSAKVKGVFKRGYGRVKDVFERFMDEANERANRGMCKNVDPSKPLSRVINKIRKKVPKIKRRKKYLRRKREETRDLLKNATPVELDGNPYGESKSSVEAKRGRSSKPIASMGDGEFQRPGGSFGNPARLSVRMGAGVTKFPKVKPPAVQGKNPARMSVRMGV